MNKVELTLKYLREELLLNDEQIKQLLKLPEKDMQEFLAERKMKVDVMRAIIASGGDEEYARSILNDPNVTLDN